MVAMGSNYSIGSSYRVSFSNGKKVDVINSGLMTTTNGCTTSGSDAIVEFLVNDNFAYAWSGTAYALGLKVSHITTIPPEE